MDFGHYSDEAAATAVDLVNSLGTPSGREYLGDPDALRQFMHDHDLQPPRSITKRDVREVHEVRAKLRRAFEAPDEAAAASTLNELLTEAGTLPHVTNHDNSGWHFHYVPASAPIAHRIAAVAAMGLATVMCEFGKERLGICSASPCRDVFVDTSRNRSRRYCNETCSSRANVAAYRARHKAASPA